MALEDEYKVLISIGAWDIKQRMDGVGRPWASHRTCYRGPFVAGGHSWWVDELPIVCIFCGNTKVPDRIQGLLHMLTWYKERA